MSRSMAVLVLTAFFFALSQRSSLSQVVDQSIATSRSDYPLASRIDSLIDLYRRKDNDRTLGGSVEFDASAAEYRMRSCELQLINSLVVATVGIAEKQTEKTRILKELDDSWNEQSAEVWTWNGLLALTDVLDRMGLSGEPIYTKILVEMEHRTDHIKYGLQNGYFGRSLLSERAARFRNEERGGGRTSRRSAGMLVFAERTSRFGKEVSACQD